MVQKLNEALQLLKKMNKKRVSIYDEWYGNTKTKYVDNIRLEAASGNITGFNGGECIFSMTLQQFASLLTNGEVTTHYEIDHCIIRREYKRVD